MQPEETHQSHISRYIVPILFGIIALGLTIPFVLNAYKNRQLAANETALVERLRAFVKDQKAHFEKKQEYAQTFSDLGGPWAEIQDMDAKKPTTLHGYHFRILKAQGQQVPEGAKSYLDDSGRMTKGHALLAVPEKYGFTGIHTFLIRDGGIWYVDLDVTGHKLTDTLQYFMIPEKAQKLE